MDTGSRVTESNVFDIAKSLLSTLSNKMLKASILDRCFAVCMQDSMEGTNVQALNPQIFCTVKPDQTQIAEILTALGADVQYETEGLKAVPTVQFLRVLGDIILMSIPANLEIDVSNSGLSFLSESSKAVAKSVGCVGITGTYDDAMMPEVLHNFEVMQDLCKVDYLKPYKSLVDNYIDKILLEYKRLFESGFGFQKPKGIMSTEGFYFVKNEELCLDRAYTDSGECNNFDYVDIVKVLSELDFRPSDAPYFDPSDALVRSNYIPKLLLYFALGCVPSNDNHYKKHEFSNNWGKYQTNVIKPYLRNVVFTQYIEAMAKAGKSAEDIRSSMNGLLDVLTRCCLVMEWNMKLSLKCRVTSVTEDFTFSTIPDRLFENIYQSVGEKIERKEVGFLEFKLIKDVKTYNNEPLFAYEALDALIENNKLPSWENVILGRLANDMTFTYDMSKWLGYHVVAASRMGKGVMCLGLLASALGSNYPIAYLDSKPDMAITVHDICPEASVCTAEQCTSLGINEDSFSSALPDYARLAMGSSSYDAFGGIIYAKALQLLLLVAEVRFKVAEGGWTCFTKEELGWDAGKNTWTKLIAFVDELEKATVHLNDELTILKTKSEPFYASKKQMQESAGEDGTVNELIENAPAYAKFANRIMKWERKLCSDLNTGSKAVFGKGQLQMVFIYQSFDQSEEASKNHKIEGLFNTLKEIPRTAKIIGGDANYYPDAAMKINELGNVLNQQKRWFSLSTCDQSILAKQTRVIEQLDKGTVVPFKPYLLLNSSGINDACVTEFLNGADDRMAKYVQNNTLIEPRIGFEPYVDYMLSVSGKGTTARDLLKTGAVIETNVLRKLGYNSINDFLFDFSVESFRSISELLELLRTGNTIDSATSFSTDGVDLDSSSFEYTSQSQSTGASGTQDISRRQKIMDEYNSSQSVYFPTVEEVVEVIEAMVSENKERYSNIFQSNTALKQFAEKVCTFVKQQGGVEL